MDEKVKINVLIRNTRKIKYHEIEDDYRDTLKKKLDKEIEKYEDEIKDLKLQLNELDQLKLQHEDVYDKLQTLYDAGIIKSNFEPVADMQ